MRILIVSLIIIIAVVKADTKWITVAKDGSGEYSTIQEALNSVTEDDSMHIIYIKNGIYHEKLFIEKNDIALVGENRDNTKIVFAELRSNWRLKDSTDYGAAVINIKNNIKDLTLMGLTVYNNYGSLGNSTDHQFSIRSGAGVTRIIIDDCNIISEGGDALSLWNTPDGMYYHNNCYFEGYVDYVCPRGYCFIENSHFYGHNKTASIWHDGSGREDNKFVIRSSSFDGVPGFPLGRYHRDAQFYLLDCTFSKNMADKSIYFYPSKVPVTIKFGHNRSYYYNCHGDSVDYSWHSDNLTQAPGSPKAEEINALWTFNGKWDPYKTLRQLNTNKKINVIR